MMSYTYNHSTWEASEANLGYLVSKFQVSLGYILRSCLKTPRESLRETPAGLFPTHTGFTNQPRRRTLNRTIQRVFHPGCPEKSPAAEPEDKDTAHPSHHSMNPSKPSLPLLITIEAGTFPGRILYNTPPKCSFCKADSWGRLSMLRHSSLPSSVHVYSLTRAQLSMSQCVYSFLLRLWSPTEHVQEWASACRNMSRLPEYNLHGCFVQGSGVAVEKHCVSQWQPFESP